MSDRAHLAAHLFEANGRRTAVFLPFALDDLLAGWARVQRTMIRRRPDEFTRDEWAYLIAFLDESNLLAPFADAFGIRSNDASESVPLASIARLARPRGPIAIWLPNNVSLLGPLTIILAALTGDPIRVKAASRVDDLATAFVSFAREQCGDDALAVVLDTIAIERFDRDDPRNRAMAADAKLRIVFGSDATAAAIDALPHSIDSIGFAFSDRASEVWLDCDRLDDETLRVLIRVFAVYGRAGCTSPRRVVLLGGTPSDAQTLRDRLAALWPSVVTSDLPMHLASQNVMARQWAAALGWDAVVAGRNAAVVASGGLDHLPADSPLFLPIVSATVEEAARTLPRNIQTLGHNGSEAWLSDVLPRLAATPVKRIVPIARMHHFGALWDGFSFWRAAFEEVEVSR
ncbi:MAG TPA: acyl-CoA reductase [Thermoanaerobaculia bacterium]|nr:acyl-CoA reductase [Thermoanaerobaculia bacterium]